MKPPKKKLFKALNPDKWWRISSVPVGIHNEGINATINEKLQGVRALAGVFKRDYAYDVFWAVFRLKTETGAPFFGLDVREVALVVSIQGREGVVSWPIPDSIRKRLTAMK